MRFETDAHSGVHVLQTGTHEILECMLSVGRAADVD